MIDREQAARETLTEIESILDLVKAVIDQNPEFETPEGREIFEDLCQKYNKLKTPIPTL